MSSTWIEIDSFALIQNVRVIRKRIGDVPIWAVVKGNAFGHDLAIASESLWRGGVDGLAVTDPNDAKWLMEQRYRLPLLVLYPVEDALLPTAFTHGWRLAVTSLDYLRRIEHFASMRQKSIKVHLEVETGMHRTGIAPRDIEEVIVKLQDPASLVQVEGMFTHLYFVEDTETSHRQISIIQELQFNLQRKSLPIPLTHVLASRGLGVYGEKYLFDAVRLGEALYGYCPYFPETTPVMTWKTKIITVGELRPDETIGYDATYEAKKIVKTAILPLGYSDGLDRRLSNRGYVLAGGKRCPIIGRVSMNHTGIDVSGLMKAEVGDEVVLIGRQGGDRITITEMAEWAGTIEDEIAARISPSVKRIKAK